MQQQDHFSHLQFAHALWAERLQAGDWAIDATCGQGKDTLYLAQLGGGVIGLDIQAEALLRTAQYLQQNLSPAAFAQVHLFHQSHESFPPIAYEKPIRLIVYNLGYLPRGDHSVTTLASTTLRSLEKALPLSKTLSITCYPGHPEGLIEQEAVLAWARSLDPGQWQVCHYRHEKRPRAPSLLMIDKSILGS